MTTGTEHDLIRGMSDAVLVAAQSIPGLPSRPTLCTEKNGQGDPYHRLRYRMPGDPAQRAIYLGRLTDDELLMLVLRIDHYWENAGTSHAKLIEKYAPDIRQLKAQLNHAMVQAKELAAKCGLYFSGYELRRHGQASDNGHNAQKADDDWLQLAELLIYEVRPCLGYLALAYQGFAVQHVIRNVTRSRGGVLFPPSRHQKRMEGCVTALMGSARKIEAASNWLIAEWNKANLPAPL